MMASPPVRLGFWLMLAGIVALGVAYDAQDRLGMVPCEICLLERMPWRVLIASGLGVAFLRGRPRQGAIILAGLCLAASVGLSVLHVGVEQGWWPSPFASCRPPATHGTTAAERFANLPLRAAKPCDAPNYLWHLPISMTALGGVYALATGMVAILIGRAGRRGRAADA